MISSAGAFVCLDTVSPPCCCIRIGKDTTDDDETFLNDASSVIYDLSFSSEADTDVTLCWEDEARFCSGVASLTSITFASMVTLGRSSTTKEMGIFSGADVVVTMAVGVAGELERLNMGYTI